MIAHLPRRILICLFLLTLAQFPCSADGTIRLPSLEQKKDLPIFVIHRKFGMPPPGAAIPRTPSVILAIWNDGYCVHSEDDLKGGPPFKTGRLGNNALQDLRKKLRGFTPPAITGYVIPDASSIIIVVRDDSTSRCIELTSSHEFFPQQTLPPNYAPFLRSWNELRQWARSGIESSRSAFSEEKFVFEFSLCPIWEPISLLIEHIGPTRKPIPCVILSSTNYGTSLALISAPEQLGEFCRKETVQPYVITSLFRCMENVPAPRRYLFGTTKVTFFSASRNVEIVLGLEEMPKLKEQWIGLSPLPPSVIQYYDRIGLRDNH